jgi:hypothetical protein
MDCWQVLRSETKGFQAWLSRKGCSQASTSVQTFAAAKGLVTVVLNEASKSHFEWGLQIKYLLSLSRVVRNETARFRCLHRMLVFHRESRSHPGDEPTIKHNPWFISSSQLGQKESQKQARKGCKEGGPSYHSRNQVSTYEVPDSS